MRGPVAGEDVDEARRQGGDPDALARLVARVMSDQRLTLAAVAERSGLAVATVAALRAGTRGKRPRPQTLEKLARGLGVQESDLLAVTAPQAADSTAQARERELLTLFRRLASADQRVVLGVVAELLRARDGDGGPGPG